VTGDFNGDGRTDIAVANDGSANATVLLNTSQPVRTISTDTLAFGSENVDSAGPAHSVTLGSSADAALKVSDVKLSGQNAQDFLVSQDTCTGASILVGAAGCSIAVRFAPSSVGPESATMTITDNSDAPATVALTGTGIVSTGGAPPPSFEVAGAAASSSGVSDRVTCAAAAAGQTCTIAETLTTVETLVKGRPVALTARKHHRKTVVVGTATATIAGGQAATIKVRLDARGRALLRRFHRLPVKLEIVLEVSGHPQSGGRTVTLTIRAPQRR
jgi:uncharacterized Zn-binding protein involved in type VI secretion